MVVYLMVTELTVDACVKRFVFVLALCLKQNIPAPRQRSVKRIDRWVVFSENTYARGLTDWMRYLALSYQSLPVVLE